MEPDPAPAAGDDEEILSFDDLEAVDYNLDDDLEPASDMRDFEEIPLDVVEDAPDFFAVGEPESPSKAPGGPPVLSGVPKEEGPAGLARLLHDALAGDSKDQSEPKPSAAPTPLMTPSPVGGPRKPPTAEMAVPKVDNISDQELSEFLLDALSDGEMPPSIDSAPPSKPLEEAGLFRMPRRGAERPTTMEVPGASALMEQREQAEQSTENSVKCGNCGGFNPEGMFYCVYCGFSLEGEEGDDDDIPVSVEHEGEGADEVACPSCGTLNPRGNRFCGSCGFKMDAPSDSEEPAKTPDGSIRTTDPSRKPSPWDIRLISINEDGSDGLEIPLDYIKTVVGRTGDTRFPTDAFLSPKHACLTIARRELYIEDLYSLNGTFVKLRDEVPLSPGDVFLMGRQVLRFEKFEQTITPKARSSDGTRYMGSPPPGGQYKLLQIGIGGVIQNVYCIPESGAVLGREKGDIIFPRDKFMSGRHAQLYPREDGTYCLVDLNSSNGTWIKIWEKTPLKDNDFIFMGQQLFRIEVNGLASPRPSSSPG